MPAFRYQALNSEGKLVKGVLEGDSDRQVRSVLRQKQLRPVEIAVALGASGSREEQSRRSAVKSMMLQIRSKVSEGHTLAHSLNQFPQAFGEMYRAMVNAGEEAGQLAPVLEQLAHYTETRQHTAQKLQMALIYPIVLIAVAIAVVAALMIFVVPELIGIFAHSKKALPPLTVGSPSRYPAA